VTIDPQEPRDPQSPPTDPTASEPAVGTPTDPTASEPAVGTPTDPTAPGAPVTDTSPVGSYPPPASSGYAPPAAGGYAPPTGGGYTPPTGGGYAAPAGGGYEPPAARSSGPTVTETVASSPRDPVLAGGTEAGYGAAAARNYLAESGDREDDVDYAEPPRAYGPPSGAVALAALGLALLSLLGISAAESIAQTVVISVTTAKNFRELHYIPAAVNGAIAIIAAALAAVTRRRGEAGWVGSVASAALIISIVSIAVHLVDALIALTRSIPTG
jgi:hypothetical protein